MTLRGYVVQLDLDLRTVRLRDCPASEGMGTLVWEGKCAPASVRALAQAFRRSTEVQAVVKRGRLNVDLSEVSCDECGKSYQTTDPYPPRYCGCRQEGA